MGAKRQLKDAIQAMKDEGWLRHEALPYINSVAESVFHKPNRRKGERRERSS